MSEPLRVVSIGGGHGLSALLEGLKQYTRTPDHPVDITAVVTVTDDGGSSGRLRREFDVLPPGDIRNCMVALSEDGALLSRLFQYRFKAGHGLKGHSFGNLFLTALTEITGDFSDAVRSSAEVLNIAGRIFPSTAANVALEAVLEDGKVLRGESRISRSRRRIREIRLVPAGVRPLPETLEAIARADLITLGPGSLFTSVVPNLLVSGIPAAIRKSPAHKACFMNLMTQPGETTNFSASDHVAALDHHAGGRLIDSVVVSTSKISLGLRKRYAAQNAAPIEIDTERLSAMGLEIIGEDLAQAGRKVRHNPAAIARIAVEMAMRAARIPGATFKSDANE
ncbi:MAG TPA: uridine diphosphate-N-acetylglucosamine-binding protein YvcK [Bryobacteraceae bacterium]|nr:uridine diphosphate-N-acetylglucosamine-binding protein YvcK [Bryobacteraceae bacterium]